MVNDKLPIRYFYPLYKAAIAIGNGCDVEDIIHYCSISGNQLLIKLPSYTRAIFVSPIPLDTFSLTIPDSEKRLLVLPSQESIAHVNINNVYTDDGLYVYDDATVSGLWAIPNNDLYILNHKTKNIELKFLDVNTPFKEMGKSDFNDYCLKKLKIESCDYYDMYIETDYIIKKPDEDIFILSEIVDLIIQSPSLDICKTIESKEYNEDKKQHPNKYSERHTKTREFQLACILNAVFEILKDENESGDYPREMNERVKKLLNADWLYNYINLHNATYNIKENEGVLSSRVRDIIRDVKLHPSKWKVIGGTKSKK